MSREYFRLICVDVFILIIHICSSTASRAICCSGQQSDLTTPIIPLRVRELLH